MTRFGEQPEITVPNDQPFNAETPLRRLRRRFVTQRDLCLSRQDESGDHRVVARALDSPAAEVWNLEGCAGDSCRRVRVATR